MGQFDHLRMESGVDTLLNTIAKYADPNYQLRKRELESDNRRANARLELAKNQQRSNEIKELNNRKIQQETLEMQRAQEARNQSIYEQGIEDKKYKEDLDEFNNIFSSIQKTGNIDRISSFLDTYNTNNPFDRRKLILLP